MCTGSKYPTEYVHRLQRAVQRNLDIPHRFRCITEHAIEGVDTVAPPTDLPGWWGKIGLFKPGFTASQNLWLDLDVVIVGSLTPLVKRYHSRVLAAPWNWAASGHGGIQSSVMLWKAEHPNGIYDSFMQRPDEIMARLHGDQEYLTELRDGGLPVTEIKSELVRSYKYHCKQGVPEGAAVVCFHGKPDPHEVQDAWVKECWA